MYALCRIQTLRALMPRSTHFSNVKPLFFFREHTFQQSNKGDIWAHFSAQAMRNKSEIELPLLITDSPHPDALLKPIKKHMCLALSLVLQLFWLLLACISCPGEKTSAGERFQHFYKQKQLQQIPQRIVSLHMRAQFLTTLKEPLEIINFQKPVSTRT